MLLEKYPITTLKKNSLLHIAKISTQDEPVISDSNIQVSLYGNWTALWCWQSSKMEPETQSPMKSKEECTCHIILDCVSPYAYNKALASLSLSISLSLPECYSTPTAPNYPYACYTTCTFLWAYGKFQMLPCDLWVQ